MSIIELTTDEARVQIAPAIGGAITAFTLRGQPILRPTPGTAIAECNVRLTGCYPLVPYSNRIRDATLRFGGREFVLTRNFGTHPHAIHGVGWQRPWTAADVSPHDARLTLHHDARGDAVRAWPWPFDATQTFHLSSAGTGTLLVATLTLVNTGSDPFPFGLGWHPFFPKDSTTRLGFAADGVWRNDETQLPREHIAVPPEWRFDSPRPLGVTALDNVFTGWRGSARIESPSRAMATTLAADSACSCLVVYAPPNGDFVAVEPVTHETDAFNRAAAGASGTGTRILPPGAAFSCTMRIASAANA